MNKKFKLKTTNAYCNHCKKQFRTDASLNHIDNFYYMKNISCGCPYCDRFGKLTQIYYTKNGKQKTMIVFYSERSE